MDANINVAVGERIRYYRKSLGISIVKLAEQLNMSKSIISRYERGEVSITLELLQKISEALKIDPFQLLDNSYLPKSFSLFQSKASDESNFEKYYVYSNASHNKAYLSTHVLLLGDERACFYGECENENNYKISKYYYTGEVRHTNSFNRVFLVNTMNSNDFIIIDISNPLGNNPLQYAFATSFSVGINYPLAFRAVLSKAIINDKNQLKELLTINAKDCRSYRESGAFFINYKDERINKLL